jgi:hypothetical protein
VHGIDIVRSSHSPKMLVNSYTNPLLSPLRTQVFANNLKDGNSGTNVYCNGKVFKGLCEQPEGGQQRRNAGVLQWYSILFFSLRSKTVSEHCR